MKICVRCGSENSSDYKYCKFCGAELPCVDRKEYKQNEAEFAGDEIEFSPESEDITIPEIDRFVGKNCEQITPRFVTLQQKGKNLSFCLPAFLFGLFFGLPGVAIWFLYRKMTKPAAFMIFGAVLVEAVKTLFLFTTMTEYYGALFSALEQYMQMAMSDPADAVQWLTGYMYQLQEWLVSETAKAMPYAVSLIDTYIIQLALPIILSLFGLSIYKKHTLKKISDIKRSSTDKVTYAVRLRREGGVSVARAIVGFLIYLALSGIVGLAPFIAAIVGL